MLIRGLRVIALVMGLAAGAVQADIIISVGNNPQTDENVLMNSGDTGNPVFGETNNTGIDVRFASITGQTLVLPSNGQARVEAENAALTSLVIDIPGGTYDSLIFNASTGSGIIEISVLDDQGNTVQASFDLGNGQNFFTTFAINGQNIVSTTLEFTTSVRDVRQVRIGGAELLQVPEPSTLALLMLGAVALSAGARRARR